MVISFLKIIVDFGCDDRQEQVLQPFFAAETVTPTSRKQRQVRQEGQESQQQPRAD